MNYQWNIFWANLNPTQGSEQSGKRPVLVISEEAVNQTLPIVTIICLTSYKPGRKIYPVEVLLEPEVSQLSQPSIAMAHQIRAISKEYLGSKCGFIESEDYRDQIRSIVKLYLDLL
ncbi:mRNA interferase MazF [Desulfitispora alkaliphila]|uniref:type II toxin-antitoxin system PemK/MazF family toxin n=1 Tax=Desulfitispora alkaliphila TaxID=622674 RepID=UPI003D221B0C